MSKQKNIRLSDSTFILIETLKDKMKDESEADLITIALNFLAITVSSGKEDTTTMALCGSRKHLKIARENMIGISKNNEYLVEEFNKIDKKMDDEL